MRHALVTGASRGIGLALVEQLLIAGDHVHAACRSPGSAKALAALGEKHPGRLSVHALDIVDADSVAALAKELDGVRIDLLINNAGVLGGTRQSFHDIDFDAWREALETNLLGTFRVSQALYPNIKLSDAPIIVNISSELGSSVWPLGGLSIYASSKGGLNRVTQMTAIELQPEGICVIAMHPGLVKTDMAGDIGVIEPEESASGIRKVIDRLTLKDTGTFYQWTGSTHDW